MHRELNGYQIRSVENRDTLAVVELRGKLSKETEYVNASDERNEANNINVLSVGGLYEVVSLNSGLVGLCISTITPGEKSLQIGLIGVLSKHQKKGIATALIENACEYARLNKLSSVRLHVVLENPKAKKLYEKLNFKEESRVTVIEMRKPVPIYTRW